MENRVTQWLLVLVLCFSEAVGVMSQGGQTGKPEEKEELFLLQDSKSVVKTDAGEMKVVRGLGGGVFGRPMHIGLITMEPKTLFIPQYLDSNLILFIRTGEVKIGFIYKDEGVEKNLTSGDVYRIPAGSTFYLVNTGSGQRLHIICSIDTSESLGIDAFQSFFIGGGTYPTSVLAGFSPETLTTAFNVSIGELEEFLTKQLQGPIMYINDSKRPSIWEKFLQLKEQDRIQHLKKMVGFQDQEEEHSTSWSWRKLLISVFGNENKKKSESESEAPESYNLYDRSPDFKNKYGWSLALDEDDYSELRRSGIGLYLVNLTAGSMMAPHVNPTATEYGIVLRGFGSVEVVFPNGTSAMKTQVKEGDVFWVPRYFPFCQIASRNGPFEFFGFTTSSRKNRPQFLAGSNSVLQTLRGSEMAAAFGVTQEVFDLIVGAQNESVIIPTPSAAPPDQMLEPENEKMMLQIERVPKLSRF